ncbi:hypothetical protein B0H10DRAFT_2182888 [Mycena sp. CBHHK59/15]|nr:hypothetical protein B0H10DRAFT_2182888 [Mycena sp. CBHHK59/15]
MDSVGACGAEPITALPAALGQLFGRPSQATVVQSCWKKLLLCEIFWKNSDFCSGLEAYLETREIGAMQAAERTLTRLSHASSFGKPSADFPTLRDPLFSFASAPLFRSDLTESSLRLPRPLLRRLSTLKPAAAQPPRPFDSGGNVRFRNRLHAYAKIFICTDIPAIFLPKIGKDSEVCA